MTGRLAAAAFAISTLSGCTTGKMGGSGLFAPKGQKWCIQCVELLGPVHRTMCEQLADSLRNTPRINARQVHSFHEDSRQRSILGYGLYHRRTDARTGKLLIPSKLATDLAMIKNLRDASGERLFMGARMVPYPSPDVGDTRWNLRDAPGQHTLQVAVFYNTDDFHDRKQAAADYAAHLRKQGFEAYYYHSETSSEVTVGSFGDDLRAAAPEVRRLRGSFKYALENGRYKWNHLDGERYRLQPMMMAIPKPSELAW